MIRDRAYAENDAHTLAGRARSRSGAASAALSFSILLSVSRRRSSHAGGRQTVDQPRMIQSPPEVRPNLRSRFSLASSIVTSSTGDSGGEPAIARRAAVARYTGVEGRNRNLHPCGEQQQQGDAGAREPAFRPDAALQATSSPSVATGRPMMASTRLSKSGGSGRRRP